MSALLTADRSAASIYAKLLELRKNPLTRPSAELLLTLRFSDEDMERVDVLSELARLGKLTAEENSEFDSYLNAGNFLAFMQVKARLFLSKKA